MPTMQMEKLMLLGMRSVTSWTMKVHPNSAGVYMGNRGGIGWLLDTAINHGVKHIQSGYMVSKQEEGAFAVALAGASPKFISDHYEFNKEVCSNQGLPDLDQLLLVSFGSTHGNGFLRAILAGMPCTNDKIAPNGHLSADYMQARHTKVYAALSGFTWKTLAPELVERYPQIVTIGQKALNTNLSSDATECEGMMVMKNTLNKLQGVPKETAFKQAVQASTVEGPFWSGWADDLARFTDCVSLEQIKAQKSLAEIALLKQSRLSVMPIRKPEYDRIVKMGGG